MKIEKDTRRLGVQDVEMTYFDRLREVGLLQRKREALRRPLSSKFGPLPSDVDARVDAVTSVSEPIHIRTDSLEKEIKAGEGDEVEIRVALEAAESETRCIRLGSVEVVLRR